MYNYSPCDDTSTQSNFQDGTKTATCDDIRTPPSDEVQITCSGEDSSSTAIQTIYENDAATVSNNQTITFISPGTNNEFLPDTVTCEVANAANTADTYQIVSFDTSGAAFNLRLKDQFGSLQLDACTTGISQLDCHTLLCYEYIVKNDGMDDVTVADLSRSINDGETLALLDRLPTTKLLSDEMTMAIEKKDVDLCVDMDYNVKAIVQATTPSDFVCASQAEYSFSTAKPPCEVGLDLSCQIFDDSFGGSCNDLGGEEFPQCKCSECPRELVFKYTATSCADVGNPGLIACIDEGPLPDNAASITVSTDTETLFSGILDNGEELIIRRQDNSCLPQQIMIVTSAFNDPSTARQVVTIDASCSSPHLTLLKSFGAVEFSGYTCTDEIPHNCYVDALYKMTASNVGLTDQTLTKFDFSWNGVTENLLEGVSEEDLELGPSQDFTRTVSKVLERCTAVQYTVNSVVESNNGECFAEGSLVVGPIEPGTASPTQVPTTLSPTMTSSLPPVPQPTDSPVQPTTPITDAPTEASLPPASEPTDIPAQPTTAPTISPTNACILDIETQCTPPEGFESCTEIMMENSVCTGRPIQMEFIYNGGDCENSFNSQSNPQFQCEDFKGGPPTDDGNESFIVVSDAKGLGTVYFAGWVQVGNTFELSDGGNEFVDDQNITIYDSNVTGPDKIIQTIVYHSSCGADSSLNQGISLKDKFGAVQLVGFTNEAQGELSCFTSSDFDIQVSVPSNVENQPVTITSMVTQYSITPDGEEGNFNFTSDLGGLEISSASAPVTVDLSIDLDLTSRKVYNVFTQISGITSTGQVCQGSDLYQFAAGQPPPPLFPTAGPTFAPTVSPPPTPDPEQTPCDLVAVLTCDVMHDRSMSCEDLKNPSEVTCVGNLSPSSLSFQYTGDRCPVNPQNYQCSDTGLNMGAARESVFIEISDGDRLIFSSIIRLNQFFSSDGEYGEGTTIVLYTVENDQRGDELQRLEILTDCDSGSDLTLLNRYGALELTGFTNAVQGEQSIQAQINLIYAVKNGGSQSATVNSALIIDAFDGGPIELIDSPFTLQPQEEQILSENNQILNLRLKEQLDRVDTFFLSVRGSSIFNELVCSDTEQLSF